jgi:Flp pilus assembly protein TadD
VSRKTKIKPPPAPSIWRRILARPIRWIPQYRREIVFSLVLAAACLAVFGPLAGYASISFDDARAGYHEAAARYLRQPLAPVVRSLGAGASLLVHIANALLVFFVLRRLTGTFWRSACASALFALHPLCVESLAWFAGLPDLLAAFLLLLSIWAYASYATAPSPARYVLVLMLYFAGLLASPTIAMLPLGLLLLDYWPLGRSKAVPLPGLVIEKIPLFVLAAASVAAAYLWPRDPGSFAPALAYADYVGQTLWPRWLGPFYDRNLPLWLAALLPAAITAAVAWRAKRWPYLATGWFWFVVMLAPMLAYPRADRFTYVPLLGVFMMLSWGLAEAAGLWPPRARAAAVAAGVAVVALGVGSALQVRRWRNGVTLFRHAVQVAPSSTLAHNRLGAALLAGGELDPAAVHLNKARDLDPKYAEAHYNLGRLHFRRKAPDQSLAAFTEAGRLDPNHALARYNRALVLRRMGRKKEALAAYDRALALTLPSRYIPLATHEAGVILSELGKTTEAITRFEETLQRDAANGRARKNLAIVLNKAGRKQEALSQLRRVLEGNPKDREAHAMIAAFNR